MIRYAAPFALVFLSACSQGDPAPAPAERDTDLPGEIVPASQVPGLETASAAAVATAANSRVLTLEGLGDVRLGQALQVGSSWSVRGAQASDTCLIATSADYPGAYAILEGGKVQRVTISGESQVRTIEGIGVGSSRKKVDDAFPGFRAQPHHYVEGGKDLFAPGADKGDPAVWLELDAAGKVTALHVGMAPVLGYVEGCA